MRNVSGSIGYLKQVTGYLIELVRNLTKAVRCRIEPIRDLTGQVSYLTKFTAFIKEEGAA